MTVDLKKRRLSGRHQILNGGEHLIDGVPFGRPRLRIPRGRPPVNIAPRKRRRLRYDDDFNADVIDDYLDGDEDVSGEYHDSSGQYGDQEDEDEEQLLLTQHGERRAAIGSRRVRFSLNTSADAELGDSASGQSGDSGAEGSGDEDESMFESDAQELADEVDNLRALAEEEARAGAASEADDDRDRFHTPDEEPHSEVDDSDDDRHSVRSKAAPHIRPRRQTRSKGGDKQKAAADSPDPFEHQGAGREATARPQVGLRDSDLEDKVTAVRFAFPQVSANACGDLLIKNNKDVSKAWKTLAKSLKPRQGLAETMVMATQLELPREVMIVSSPSANPDGSFGEVSRIDEAEEGEPSSSEEDKSDSSDEDSEDDNGDHAPGGEGEGERESDSDSDSDSTSEEDSELTPRVAHRGSNMDSSSSSEESSSGNKPQKKNLSCGRAKRSAARVSSSDKRTKNLINGSSSESEASEPLRANVCRGRKTIKSSPPNSRRTKASPKGASTSTGTNSSESGSDDESSSEDSSSDSSSESSSESEDEPTGKSAQSTKTKKIATPQAVITPNRPSARRVPPSESQKSSQTPVPPGQGLTKTQKRNQRRKLHAQRKKEALAAAAGSQCAQDTTMTEIDLAAKKAALLHTLGAGSNFPDQDSQPTLGRDVSMTAGDTQASRAAAGEDLDAWKQKIFYRAVEVVQEGVELSEPPFPFVQRWDPQQRWTSQRNSQRRGKRKSRDDFQFYDDPSIYNAKKRRFRQPDADDYYYQEDTTTFLGEQEDVMLDYDDVSFNPDDSPMFTDRTPGLHMSDRNDQVDADTDDLPPLPKDMSSLPELRTSELKKGVIIAYKQLLCTEATKWQPQLSDFVTATVSQIYDTGKQEFQVQLARRDRNVDRNERKYDEETGQRIYGKFEAPDEDEEEEVDGEDEGFRDVFFGQMVEARVVQSANDTDKTHASGSGQLESGFAAAEAPQVAQFEFEVADSQTEEGLHGNKAYRKDNTDLDMSGTLDHEIHGGHGRGQALDNSCPMDVGITQLDVAMDDSFVSETNHDIDFEDEDGVSAQAISPASGDGVSIREGRRGEISQLTNDGGFRQEVRSCIDQSSFLRFGGSPSRQLEEEMEASALLAHQTGTSRTSSSSDAAPSEYGSKELSQLQGSNQHAEHPDPDAFHSTSQPLSVRKPGSAPLNGDDVAKQMATTGEVNHPKIVPSQTSQNTQASEQSAARQLDPNFITHSDDLGIEPLVDSASVANGFEDDTAPRANCSNGGRERTPTQMYKDDPQDARAARTGVTMFRSTQISPSGSARSADSTGSSSQFTDIELIGSQPVQHKRKGFSPRIKDESASPNSADVSESARGTNDGSASKSDEHISSQFSVLRNRRSSGQGKIKNVDAFSASISPPALSRLRRKPDPAFLTAASSQDSSSGNLCGSSQSSVLKSSTLPPNGAAKKSNGPTFAIPKGSQVVSLLSSPAPESHVEVERGPLESESGPESEPEPIYTEMYADESIDGDYDDGAIDSLPRRIQPRRTSTFRKVRGASVPIADKQEASSPNWVSGSQGPSRKASGRFGGRFSAGGY